MIEISDSSPGSSHLLPVGEELELRLPENPTTGYRWEVRLSGAGELKLIADTFAAGGGSPAPGAAGQRLFRFVGARQGPVTVEAVERRDWEPPTAARQTRTFQIDVG